MSDSFVFIRLPATGDDNDLAEEVWLRVDRIDGIVSTSGLSRVYLGRDYWVDTSDRPEEVLKKMGHAIDMSLNGYSDDLDYEEPDE